MYLRYRCNVLIMITMTLFLGILFLLPRFSFAAGDTAVVAAEIVNVRSGPGTGYALISQVGLGQHLPILNQSGEWYQISLPSGEKGWLANWLVNVNKAPAATPAQGSSQTVVVNVDCANIRGGPGANYNLVSQVVSGNCLTVLEKSGDWYKVRLNTGSTGWIAGWLVTVAAAAAPPQQPAPTPAPPATQSEKIAIVTGSVVNVRSGPGTSCGISGQAYQGDNLPVISQSGDWYRVKLPGGATGYIAGWLLSVRAAPQPQPTQPTQPQQPQQPQQPAPVQTDRGGDPRGDSGKNDSQSGKALSLKISNSGSKTNAVVVADKPFDYSSFYLSGPDRLVVDLKGIAIGDLPAATAVNSKTVRQVRTGYFQKNPDITRLVFDLSGGVQYVASLSNNNKTLTVQTYIPDIEGSYAGKIIAIDAGHGGPEPGAVGKNGTKEKDITLDVAKRVAKLLESRGAKVIMTRSGDQDVGLYERTDKANKAKAGIFVSIHINAHTDPAIGGTSTYIYSGANDRTQATRIAESDRLARYVQAELVKTLGLRDIGVKSANFAVLRTANMPAILAELAFISNKPEEKYINTDVFKNGAAEAIVKGIGLYLSERRTA